MRRGEMLEISYDDRGGVRLEYKIPTRGLIGFRNAMLTLTAGNGIMGSLLLGYRPWAGDLSSVRNGALTASEGGTAVAYGLANAQERGTTFIEPGERVYEGMIVGHPEADGRHRGQRLQGEEEDQHPQLNLRHLGALDAGDEDEPGAVPRLPRGRRAARGHPQERAPAQALADRGGPSPRPPGPQGLRKRGRLTAPLAIAG